MVLATIKFVFATSKLNNKRKKNECKSKAEKFTNNGKICANKQIAYKEKNLSM